MAFMKTTKSDVVVWCFRAHSLDSGMHGKGARQILVTLESERKNKQMYTQNTPQ